MMEAGRVTKGHWITRLRLRLRRVNLVTENDFTLVSGLTTQFETKLLKMKCIHLNNCQITVFFCNIYQHEKRSENGSTYSAGSCRKLVKVVNKAFREVLAQNLFL